MLVYGFCVHWLVVSTPLKKIYESMKVSWDSSSQYMEKTSMFQTTKQFVETIIVVGFNNFLFALYHFTASLYS